MSAARVAVVTGAARAGSIGRAICAALLRDGVRVVCSDLGRPMASHPGYDAAAPDELAEAADALAPLGEISTFPCDVRHAEEVEALLDHAGERFGRLDILINNAGIGIGLQEVVDIDEADWQVNLDVMATGMFLCSRGAARRMVAQGDGGRIVTICSQAAKTGHPLMGAYTAAKWAALGLTQVLAQELGEHGITANAVCPGTVDTPMLRVGGGMFDAYTARTGLTVEQYRRRLLRTIPLGRFAEPDDIAASVAFLVSPGAAYITGESINVSGGSEMH